ncbi:MAG: hypothetical protein AB8E15_04745 [Bdellovibrionales bacterium]
MRKISGILPSNSRITSVDLKNSQPVRSGDAAHFGRSIVKSEVVRTAPKLTLNEAPKVYDKVSARRTKDQANAEIVRKMSSSFFDTRLNKTELKPMTEQMIAAQKPVRAIDLPQDTVGVKRTENVMAPFSFEAESGSYVDEHVNSKDYGAVSNAIEDTLDSPDFNMVGSNLSITG